MAVNTDMQNCPLFRPFEHGWSLNWALYSASLINDHHHGTIFLGNVSKWDQEQISLYKKNCGIISARQQVFCGPHQINPSRRSDGTFSKINRCPMQQFVLQYIQPRYASRPQTWNLEAKLWWNPMRMSSIVWFHFVPLSQKCRNQAYIKAGLTDGWPPGCS